MNIYVGNLSGDVGDGDLRGAFEPFGEVASATVIKDKFTGKSRGFGFVEMPDDEAAKSAIEGLNGEELMGQTLSVNEARPRAERRHGSGRFGGDRGAQGGFKGGHSGGRGAHGGGKGKFGTGGGGRRGNR